jgi:hypothetical protein
MVAGDTSGAEVVRAMPGDGKSLCGCWNAINTNPGLDLRRNPVHGHLGHHRHATTVHAWCSTCSPRSVRLFRTLFPIAPAIE